MRMDSRSPSLTKLWEEHLAALVLHSKAPGRRTARAGLLAEPSALSTRQELHQALCQPLPPSILPIMHDSDIILMLIMYGRGVGPEGKRAEDLTESRVRRCFRATVSYGKLGCGLWPFLPA